VAAGAITLLSIYLNPLFLAGLILMHWAFYHLTLAERFRTDAARGLCGAVPAGAGERAYL